MDYFVRDYGAIPDGKTLNTEAIQKTIDACSACGGGRVIISGGAYMSGTIVLKQNVILHIESDSILLGSPRCEDYIEYEKKHVDIPKLPRVRGTSLIFAEECENIGISGMGKIDGNGDAFIEKIPGGELYDMPYRRIDAPTPPRVVFFTGCKNVRVTDVTMENQPAGWSYWIHDCDIVTVDRIKIFANIEYPNNDGIHINCSRNVTVSNCIISCGDDSLVIRANSRSLKEPKICEKVTVTNCNLTSHSGGVRIGWINDGIIRNCSFSNLVMTDTTVGISLLIPEWWDECTDFGVEDTLVENITFSNIIMDRIASCPIYIDYPEDEHNGVSAVRNLYFDGIHARGAELPYLRGRKASPIENVYFNNCTFHELNREVLNDGRSHGYVMCKDKHPHILFVSNVKNFVCNNTSITTE